ncbi:TetR/AcrR family transcriptional regulator [Millisia brevis]|uniref:TetR/AcrR family transcriptional regulator n=1 Tax=Millisia brevis TaxID=264148 RepID=UPI00082B22D2|nr:TetR/AcrR family transcriptional regulator [Millisia brevis]
MTSGGGRAGTKGVPRRQREQQILDVATTEFGRKGYANASLAVIAAAAGVSKPLIYSYFGSRDGLHAACVDRAGTVLVDAVARAQHARGVGGRAIATLSGIIDAIDGRTEDWTIIFDATLPRPSGAHSRAKTYRDALNTMGRDGVADILGTSDAASEVDRSLVVSWWFSIVSTTIAWWADHPEVTAEEMTDRCRRLLTVVQRPAHPSTAPDPVATSTENASPT